MSAILEYADVDCAKARQVYFVSGETSILVNLWEAHVLVPLYR